MSKIAIVSNSIAGLYSFRKEVIKKFRDEGHAVVIVGPRSMDEREGYFADLGCGMIDIKMERHGKNPAKELALIREYKQILKHERPDIVFTYTIKPNIYGGMACAALNIPYVANITGLGTAVENPGIMQKIMLPLMKYGLRKAQKVFFQNSANQDFLVGRGVVKGAYDLLPGSGVNLENYTCCDYPQGEKTEFVFMSRIMKEKGIDQYLQAAEAIRAGHPNTVFHVCGGCEQDYKARLEEMTNKGIIVYHGKVLCPGDFYQKCSCTVHPTYYPEGLSNVLLESCATGRPIITTDRPGCREVVDDGVNGYIVREKDGEDLIEKIERFLALSMEEKRAMGLAGRKKVEKCFDRNIVIDKYMAEVNRL